MKRCPQCEFVYEDEQSLCDMDGSKLVFDSRKLPKLQALNNAAELSTKGFWRGRIIPTAASLVLATVLGLVYYVSTQQTRQTQTIPAATRQQTVGSQPEEPPKPDAEFKSKPEAELPANPNEKVAEKPAAKAKPDNGPEATKKKGPSSLNAPQPQPAKPTSVEEKPKKETKVSAILKKTGRILKKTFKV